MLSNAEIAKGVRSYEMIKALHLVCVLFQK